MSNQNMETLEKLHQNFETKHVKNDVSDSTNTNATPKSK